MRARDRNWMQVEEYLSRDDRVVLPLGSTEQHGYLSLETDNILAERVSAEAAELLGVLVLPVLPYGLTPNFAAYPGSPSLRLETFAAVLRDLLDSLHDQGFRRFLLVNGHGGNMPGHALVREWVAVHPGAQALFHNWWSSARVAAAAQETGGEKPPLDFAAFRASGPEQVRELLGDGVFEGVYQLPDEQVEQVWRTGVEEVRELLESGWRQ
jgi:creatinine amidohydrolase